MVPSIHTPHWYPPRRYRDRGKNILIRGLRVEPVTELAYLADMPSAYERSFRSRVLARPPGAVVLARTLFYPTGGGQLCDLGTLRTGSGAVYPVVEVRKSGETVLHRLGRPTSGTAAPPMIGEEVEGEIDWTRRHTHMRLHTGQHLLSAVLFRLAGLKTRRASMEGLGGTIDLEGPWPPTVPFDSVAPALRSFLEPPREVRIVQVPRAEWELHPAPRSGAIPLPPHVDPVRVIEIDGIDRCPCGGTHVRSTGEVGPMELLPVQRQSGGSDRVVFRLAAEAIHSPRVTP
jgi:misacylated tRNA(Ala) deacylase